MKALDLIPLLICIRKLLELLPLILDMLCYIAGVYVLVFVVV